MIVSMINTMCNILVEDKEIAPEYIATNIKILARMLAANTLLAKAVIYAEYLGALGKEDQETADEIFDPLFDEAEKEVTASTFKPCLN